MSKVSILLYIGKMPVLVEGAMEKWPAMDWTKEAPSLKAILRVPKTLVLPAELLNIRQLQWLTQNYGDERVVMTAVIDNDMEKKYVSYRQHPEIHHVSLFMDHISLNLSHKPDPQCVT